MARRPTSSRGSSIVQSYKDGSTCPVATHDVHENLKNRDHAIEEYGYGPMNPGEPNKKYWEEIADLWGISVQEAKTSRCGNCAAFVQTKKMMDCIVSGMAGDESFERDDASRVSDAANLGYCQLFHFKCAGDRTCHAWLYGGPIK